MSVPEQCHTLARGQSLLCESTDDLLLTCQYGRLWLTQHGDSRDRILNAGGSFTVIRGSNLIISALHPSQFHLTHLPAEPGSFWQRLRRSLNHAFRGRWQCAANANFRNRFQ